MTEKKVILKRGPVPDIKKDREVLKLKNSGLSFRQISAKTGEDLKNVWTRHQRALVSLSTGLQIK